MNKPLQILELEKQIGFRLKGVKITDLGKYITWDYKQTYLLNQQEEIIGLNLDYLELRKLDILQEFKNLQALNVSHNMLRDASFLKNLKNLAALNISYNDPKGRSSLKHLPQLKQLNLGGSVLSNCSFLSALNELEVLNLEYNPALRDISILKNLPKLHTLDLSSNNLMNYSSLKEFSELKTLILKHSKKVNFSFLKDLKQLQNIDISRSNLQNISFLKYLSQLKSITLEENEIYDISILKDFSELKTLKLYYNKVQSISVLQYLDELQFVDLKYNVVQDLSPLLNLKNLQELNLTGNFIQDITPLKNLSNLKTLNISRNFIQDISPLKNLINLKHLDIQETIISDFAVLENLQNLQSLEMNHNSLKNSFPLIPKLITLRLHDSESQDYEYIELILHLQLALEREKKHQLRDFSFLQSLTSLRKLSIKSAKLLNITFVKSLHNLQHLTLDNCNITEISSIKHLQKLVTLELPHNFIQDLSIIRTLHKLKKLSLGYTPINDISILDSMKELEELDISYTQLKNLYLDGFKNLKKIKISGNQFENICISNSGVIDFNWQEFKVKNISLINLPNLNSLQFNRQEINNIHLENLPFLSLLKLQNYEFKDMSFVNEFKQLKHLELHSNTFDELTLSDLKNLTELYIGVKPKKVHFSNLLKIEHLNIKYCEGLQLKNLPSLLSFDGSHSNYENISFVKAIPHIQSLDLNHNQSLSDLSALKELKHLQILNLNRCESIPSDLSFLKESYHLQKLYLNNYSYSQNNLLDLSELKNLKELTTLSLERSLVKDYSIFEQLPQLQHLNLARNQLKDISFLAKLTNLDSLNLSSNQIQNISTLAKLQSLKSLRLDYNQVQDISIIRWFKNLETLYLSQNKIKYISLSFLNTFTKLKKLELSGNPVKNIPKELYYHKNNCLEEIRNYLEDSEKGTTKNKEVKIILIGNGSVGKTQIAKRLVEQERYVFDTQHDSTHGIVLLQRELEDLTLNIWDFAGQDIYHATHRLFMQTRALFVLVWDTENEQKTYHTYQDRNYRNEKLQYWLEYASYFGQGSPILVIQNKVDVLPYVKNSSLKKLQTNYQNHYSIINYIEVSALTSYNFVELESWLSQSFEQDEQLKQTLLQEIPVSWANVRSQIRDLQKQQLNTISYSYFRIMCEQEGISKSTQTLLNYLHDTGVLYHKKHYFDNQIILNQAWAIEAVYAVLDKDGYYFQTGKPNQGQIQYIDLQEIWKEYSNEERKIFIDFMLSAELCFETTFITKKRYSVPFEERTFIIPQLLPEEKPSVAIAWQNTKLGAKSKFKVFRPLWNSPFVKKLFFKWNHFFKIKIGVFQEVISYKFLPSIFIQRFIVKNHSFSQSNYMWQSGILLEKGGYFGLVEADFSQKKISILSNSVQLIEEIKNELNYIAHRGNLSVEALE